MTVTGPKIARDLASNVRRTPELQLRRKINQSRQRDLIILLGISLIFRYNNHPCLIGDALP